MTNKYIYHCIFNKETNPLCPAFSVKQILEDAELDPQEWPNILRKVFYCSFRDGSSTTLIKAVNEPSVNHGFLITYL